MRAVTKTTGCELRGVSGSGWSPVCRSSAGRTSAGRPGLDPVAAMTHRRSSAPALRALPQQRKVAWLDRARGRMDRQGKKTTGHRAR